MLFFIYDNNASDSFDFHQITLFFTNSFFRYIHFLSSSYEDTSMIIVSGGFKNILKKNSTGIYAIIEVCFYPYVL